MKRPFMVWIGFISTDQFVAQTLPRKVALGCWYYKKLLKTLKVAQKLPSTIYLCIANTQNEVTKLIHDHEINLDTLLNFFPSANRTP